MTLSPLVLSHLKKKPREQCFWCITKCEAKCVTADATKKKRKKRGFFSIS